MMIIILILLNFYLIPTVNTHKIYNQSEKYSSESDGHAKKPMFLSPYINSGEILLAQNLSRVLPLNGSGNLKSYSGFLTVDEIYNSNLFFWFFPSEKNYTDAPIILWLQGGPGQSSMFGLFEENGPFYVTNEQELKLRGYSWSLTNSVLYIDNPVGAGFSFTDNEKGYAKDQDDIRKNLYNALIQFFKLFPDLLKNDFYVCGESYGGKYVPAIAYSIHENNPKSEIKINLKGLCIGNGFSDPINMLGYSKYLYQIGLIDKNHVKYLREFEYKTLKHIHNKQWDEALVMKGSILGHVDLFTGGVNMYNYVSDNYSDLEFRFPYVDFIESDHVREAIHVGNVSFYRVNPFVYDNLKYDILKSVKPWVEILLEYYRIFFYSGQLDIIVAYPFTEKFIKHLQWSGANEYNNAKRMVVTENYRVAGYVKMAGNLNFALIRNAGHMVPADQPAWAYKFLQRFLINAESDDLSLFYNERYMDY